MKKDIIKLVTECLVITAVTLAISVAIILSRLSIFEGEVNQLSSDRDTLVSEVQTQHNIAEKLKEENQSLQLQLDDLEAQLSQLKEAISKMEKENSNG